MGLLQISSSMTFVNKLLFCAILITKVSRRDCFFNPIFLQFARFISSKSFGGKSKFPDSAKTTDQNVFFQPLFPAG